MGNYATVISASDIPPGPDDGHSQIEQDRLGDTANASESLPPERATEQLLVPGSFSKTVTSVENATIDALTALSKVDPGETADMPSSIEMSKSDKNKRPDKGPKNNSKVDDQGANKATDSIPTLTSTTTEPPKAAPSPYLYFQGNTASNPTALTKEDPFISNDKPSAGSLFANLGPASRPANLFGTTPSNTGLPDTTNGKPKSSLFTIPNVTFPLPEADGPSEHGVTIGPNGKVTTVGTSFGERLPTPASTNPLGITVQSQNASEDSNARLSNPTPSIFEKSSNANTGHVAHLFGRPSVPNTNNLFGNTPSIVGASQTPARSQPRSGYGLIGTYKTPEEALAAFPPRAAVTAGTNFFGQKPSPSASLEASDANAKASMNKLVAGLSANPNSGNFNPPKAQFQLSEGGSTKDLREEGKNSSEAKPAFAKDTAANALWPKAAAKNDDAKEKGNGESTSIFGATEFQGFGGPFNYKHNIFGGNPPFDIWDNLECWGTANVNFRPLTDREGLLQCISAMKPYQKFSLEELRLGDYASGRHSIPRIFFPSPGTSSNQIVLFDSNKMSAQTSTTLTSAEVQQRYGPSSQLYHAVYGLAVDSKMREKMAAAQENLRKITDSLMLGPLLPRGEAQINIAKARLAYHVACLDSWVISRYDWNKQLSTMQGFNPWLPNPFDRHLQALWSELKAHKTAFENQEKVIHGDWPFKDDEDTLLKQEGLVKFLNQM